MKFPKTFTLQTDRCNLRIASRADIPHIFSATRHAGFNDGMRWDPPVTELELEAPYEHNIAVWEDGSAYCFSIDERSSGAFIGRVSIRREAEDGVWSIGFWTHPNHQGKGFMSEAVSVLIDFGFSSVKASKIEACHALWNKASECILKKLGMEFVKYEPQGFMKKGEWVEQNLLAITNADWRERRSNKL